MVREKSNDIPFPKKKETRCFWGGIFFVELHGFFGGDKLDFFVDLNVVWLNL